MVSVWFKGQKRMSWKFQAVRTKMDSNPPPDIETEHPIGPVMPPLFAPEAHGKVKRGVLG
jgi:hypothetical protein